MPKLHTELLTPDLYRRLSGAEAGARANEAIVLCTTDAVGWPHPAMIGYFELAALDRHTLRLAIYSDSRTCANLRERRKATFIVVDADVVCYINGTVEAVAPEMREAPHNARVSLRVSQVVFDTASPELESRTEVTGGITYTPRTGTDLARAHAVLAELLEG
jgi:hypothetical protein